MSKKNQEKIADDAQKREADAILRMAFIGRHVMDFACQCVARKEDPRLVLETMCASVDPKKNTVPIASLWKWINYPTPLNVRELSQAFGFDIEKTSEKMMAEFTKKTFPE